jgi:hypothetical protein
MKMFLFFSHELTDDQIKDANSMGIDEFVRLPEKLQKKWSHVPAQLDNLDEYIEDFYKFLDAEAQPGDYVLVQGDFGMCCKTVDYCRQKSLLPVYATSERVSKEIRKGDRIIKTSEFRHIKFRRY